MKTYYAKSVFNDGQTWFNFLSFVLVVLEMKEVINWIPADYQQTVTVVVLVINAALRFFFVKRPVAAIRPGRAKKVQVHSLPEKEVK